MVGSLRRAAACFALGAGPAEALPSYARQTGQPCAACHTAFPELTPFGRRFKIGGYTLQGGDWQGPPLAAMYMARLSRHTQARRPRRQRPPARSPQACTPTTIWPPSRCPASSPASSIGNLGSFIQITGDPVGGGRVGLDASDVRYADTFKLFGKDTIWGIDANNTPTIEDPWNTTPVLGLAADRLDHRAGASARRSTHIEGGYGQIVGGAGAYVFWNDMLYADVTAYKGLPVPRCRRSTSAIDDRRGDQRRALLAPRDRAALGRPLPDGRHVRDVRPGRAGPAVRLSAPTTILDVGFDSAIPV